MNTTITQEAYDEEVRELMEGLGMTEEEAIQDAIKCYEMKVLTAFPLFTPFADQRKTSFLLLSHISRTRVTHPLEIFTFGIKKEKRVSDFESRDILENFSLSKN